MLLLMVLVQLAPSSETRCALACCSVGDDSKKFAVAVVVLVAVVEIVVVVALVVVVAEMSKEGREREARGSLPCAA